MGDDGCVSRTISATSNGFMFGSVLGAISATWGDVPKVVKGDAYPGVAKTLQVMGAYGATFAFVGAAFAAGECISENMRGKKDFWNAAVGGAFSGAVVGLRVGRLGVGIGAASALAAASAGVELTGGKWRGTEGIVGDGATPSRTYFPYGAVEK